MFIVILYKFDSPHEGRVIEESSKVETFQYEVCGLQKKDQRRVSSKIVPLIEVL